MTTLNNVRSGEKGNALFLILIAVVLFAALSYAITQSNRGGGAPNRETSLVSSTTVTQYSSAIRTGITRMLLRNIALSDIKFADPTAYSVDIEEEVFHPSGGGVSYQNADINTVDDGIASFGWHFTANSEVTNIGINGASGKDLIAFLVGVREPICQRINEQISGDPAIPDIAAVLVPSIVADTAMVIGGAVIGQPFYCVESNGTGTYVFYHVLAEQ